MVTELHSVMNLEYSVPMHCGWEFFLNNLQIGMTDDPIHQNIHPVMLMEQHCLLSPQSTI